MITQEEIQKIGDMARIALPDEKEVEEMRGSIASILEYVGELTKIEVSDEIVEAFPVHHEENVFREDIVIASEASPETLQDLFPVKDNDMLVVQKILS